MVVRFAHAVVLLVSTLAAGDLASGYACTQLSRFKSRVDAQTFLSFVAPLASYVRDNETSITYTYRPFLRHDGLAVLNLERLVSKAAHDGPHLGSAAHHKFAEKWGAWNTSTGAVIGVDRGEFNETDIGVFSRSPGGMSALSGFACTVTYGFKHSADSQHYLRLLAPFADYVRQVEAGFTYTFRPFLSTDGLSVLLLQRYASRQAHDVAHTSSDAHRAYSKAVHAWNSTSEAIVSEVRMNWTETPLGMFTRNGTAAILV